MCLIFVGEWRQVFTNSILTAFGTGVFAFSVWLSLRMSRSWRLHLFWGCLLYPWVNHKKAYGFSHILYEYTLRSWVTVQGFFIWKLPLGFQVLPGFGFKASLFFSQVASSFWIFALRLLCSPFLILLLRQNLVKWNPPSQTSADYILCHYSTNSVCFLSCWHDFIKNNL